VIFLRARAARGCSPPVKSRSVSHVPRVCVPRLMI
jgi:hypothetical protein